jgi:hypothetical protein
VDLDEPVQGLQELLMADSGAALQKQNKAAEMSVRGVLTAMSVKIPITKLLKMAYTTSEASVITELWLLLCGKLPIIS